MQKQRVIALIIVIIITIIILIHIIILILRDWRFIRFQIKLMVSSPMFVHVDHLCE